MRPGPATRAASYVDSWSSLSTHGGGMTAPARQRSKPYRVPHLPKPVADPSPCDHASTPRGWPAALSRSLLRRAKNGVGEEAATPWATSSRSRTFLDFPRQFTLENHRLPLPL